MNRKEHLQWCKKRALAYVEAGDIQHAWRSMVSDLQKHDETKDHIAIQMGIALMAGGDLFTKESMREFIQGFN